LAKFGIVQAAPGTEAGSVISCFVRHERGLTSSAAKEYEAAFHLFKPDKHLQWLQQLGTATLSIELEDRVVEVEATPLQASLIELFEETDAWKVEDLVEKTGAAEEAIEAGLAFWKAEGVVKEDGGKWVLLERAE
jgi:anaphase-promoting complex subunit 2